MSEEKKVTLNEAQLMQMFEMENRRLNESQQRINSMRLALNETILALDSVKGIAKAKKNEKILIPVGAGIFAEAKIEETKQFLEAIPGGVVKYNSFAELEKRLEKNSSELEERLGMEIEENNKIATNLNNFGAVLSQIENTRRQQRKRV